MINIYKVTNKLSHEWNQVRGCSVAAKDESMALDMAECVGDWDPDAVEEEDARFHVDITMLGYGGVSVLPQVFMVDNTGS